MISDRNIFLRLYSTHPHPISMTMGRLGSEKDFNPVRNRFSWETTVSSLHHNRIIVCIKIVLVLIMDHHKESCSSGNFRIQFPKRANLFVIQPTHNLPLVSSARNIHILTLLNQHFKPNPSILTNKEQIQSLQTKTIAFPLREKILQISCNLHTMLLRSLR